MNGNTSAEVFYSDFDNTIEKGVMLAALHSNIIEQSGPSSLQWIKIYPYIDEGK